MSVFGKAGRRGRNRDRNRTTRPVVEPFEDRTLLSTFTVTKTIDDGSTGTLRWAIGQANSTSGSNTIGFNIGAVGSQQTIQPTSELPAITGQVTIDGLSQGGSGYAGPLLVTIDGSKAGAGADGLILQGTNSAVDGLVIINFAGGAGIHVESTGDTITDNLIGTDGDPAHKTLGNQEGVFVDGSTNNASAMIGGTAAAAANTIGFNSVAGISISGSKTTGNSVLGNYIGTDPTGDSLPNQVGVSISGSGNTVGGTTTGAGNTIAFNKGDGVDVPSGNGDAIRQNLIYGNGGQGILLGNNANDGQAAPSVQHVASVTNLTTIDFSVTPNAKTGDGTYTVDFFANSPSSVTPTVGPAYAFLGSASVPVTVGGTTAQEFTALLTTSTAPLAVPSDWVVVVVPAGSPMAKSIAAGLRGQTITATVTDPNKSTSELATPTPTPAPAQTAFTVSNATDGQPGSAVGSLRVAILDSNFSTPSPGPTNPIKFAIPGPGPLFTISPTAVLPTIGKRVTIDGSTESAFLGTAATVQLDGGGQNFDGLTLGAGSGGSTIHALDIANFQGAGINIQSNGNTITDDLIGTDATGLAAGPGNQTGILINGSNNVIGGTVNGAANTIAFNTGAAVDVASGTGNAILQNLIFANGAGIVLGSGANHNLVAPTVLAAASVPNLTTIDYQVTGTVGQVYTIEFFASSGVGNPAARFLGSVTTPVLTSSPQSFTATFALATPVAAGQTVTATTTSAGNDTSPLAPSVGLALPFQVTNTTDNVPGSEVGSLRVVLLDANNSPPPAGQTDHITFAIPGTSPFVITPTAVPPNSAVLPMPTIGVPVTIDGTTESSFLGQPAVVQLNGGGQSIDGLTLGAGSGGSTITGLDIANFNGAGIHIESSSDTITDNLIGTNPAGTGVGPGNQIGIFVDGSSNVLIGGNTANAANTIGFNTAAGVSIGGAGATGNQVIRNFIGTDSAGRNLGNALGVSISTSGNEVGQAGAGNTIGFNYSAGVAIGGSGATGNRVIGNFIGTDATGDNLHNLVGLSVSSAGNTVGGAAAGDADANTIGFNTAAGVSIGGAGATGNQVIGNFIGIDPSLAPPNDAVGNAIGVAVGSAGNTVGGTAAGDANTIGFNNLFGISLISGAGNVVSENEYDGKNGPNLPVPVNDIGLGAAANNNQAAPIITSTAYDPLTHQLRLLIYENSATAPPQQTLEIYLDLDTPTQRKFEIAAPVTLSIDPNNPTPVLLTVPGLKSTDVLIATVTDPTNGTSAFSGPTVIPGPYVVTTADDNGPGSLRQAILNADQPHSATVDSVTSVPNLTTINYHVIGILGQAYTIEFTTSPTGGPTQILGSDQTAPLTTSPQEFTKTFTLLTPIPPGQTVTATIVPVAITFAIFAIPGTQPFFVISPNSALPTITAPVTIDGTTEQSMAPSAVVQINGGGDKGNKFDGLTLGTGSDGSTIKGLEIVNFAQGTDPNTGKKVGGNGIRIESSGDTIVNNTIGVDTTGNGRPGNTVGVFVDTNGVAATIGGTTASDANIIGNNVTGVSIGGTTAAATGNMVIGNYIGIDPSLASPNNAVGNTIGVAVSASNNTIGGAITDTISGTINAGSNFQPGNIIGFSSSAGISISAAGVSVQGNFIGTDLAGDDLMNTAAGSGIVLDASGETIGGTNTFSAPNPSTHALPLTTLQGNVIGHIGNTAAAISIKGGSVGSGNTVVGNFIGVDPINPKVALSNSIGIQISSISQGNTIGGSTLWNDSGMTRSDANYIGFNSGAGIKITGSDKNVVQANYIGTEPGGYDLANGDGVLLEDASNNTVGGHLALRDAPNATTADPSSVTGNIIGFNTIAGVLITSASGPSKNNAVQGNYIGTDPSGDDLGNVNGVEIDGAGTTNNTIGSPNIGATPSGNIISANSVDGIFINGAISNSVVGNIVGSVGDQTFGANSAFGSIPGIANGTGLDSGAPPVPGNFNGIHVGAGSSSNLIGGKDYTSNPSTGAIGSLASSANMITGNLADGIRFDQVGSSNSISGNLISQNSHNGIDINGAGSLSINDNLIGTNNVGTKTYDPNAKKTLGNLLSGIQVSGTTDATISGNVISGNGLSGINLSGGHAVGTPLLIQDNLIGTDITGTAVTGPQSDGSLPFGNVLNGIGVSNFTGVSIGGSASGGGVELALGSTRGNLISGNLGRGIELDAIVPNETASDITIAGNLIGVVFGSTGPNKPVYGSISSVDANSINSGNLSDGVFVLQASGGSIQGASIQGDVISSNRGYGIHVSGGGGSLGLTISGDFIGTNQDGTQAVVGGVTPGNLIGDGVQTFGNGADGVFLDSASGIQLSGNVISANRANGIDLLNSSMIPIVGNKIGTDVNGDSQPGSPRSDFGNASNGIFINGSNSNVVGGALSTSYNVIAGNHGSGIFVSGSSSAFASSNAISGNYIGISRMASGQYTVIPNAVAGIILSNASNNRIGGTDTSGENVISGNSLDGILLVNNALNNAISYNLIGTDPSGVGAVPNSADGVFMLGSSDAGLSIPGVVFNNTPSTVSGNTVSHNTISGNGENGVQIFGQHATGNNVLSNVIGLAADGQTSLINGGNKGNGVELNNDGGLNVIGQVGSPNVISGNGQAGVLIFGTDRRGGGDYVIGNLIGTNAAGTAAVLNGRNGGDGVFIYGTSSSSVSSNVISGNAQAGIEIFSPAASAPAQSNTVSANLIGVNASGTAAVPNLSDGIDIFSGQYNTIGQSGSRNVISGNLGNGVLMVDVSNQPPIGNTIGGNYIGVGSDGSTKVPNILNGVYVQDGTRNQIGLATGNSIANTNVPAKPSSVSSGPSNVISGNGGAGIQFSANAPGNFVQGNYIGVGVSGSGSDPSGLPLGNSVAGVFVNDLGNASSGEVIGGSASGSGNIISGSSGGYGVYILGPAVPNVPGGSTVEGNVIGLDGNGALAGNNVGVYIQNSAGNLIGDTATGARNVISGNAFAGVEITGLYGTGNTVRNNFIGTNTTGNGIPGNLPFIPSTTPGASYQVVASQTQQNGVYLLGATSNTVGGTVPGTGNVIGGNISGVNIEGQDYGTGGSVPIGNNVVDENFIGVSNPNLGPQQAVPNYDHGVLIDNSAANTIGGTGSGNQIAANGIDGVEIFGGISQKAAGVGSKAAVADHNYVIGNSIGLNIGNYQPGMTSVVAPQLLAGQQVQTPDGPIITFGSQLYGVVVIGSSSNIIGSKSSGNVISGNISTGVYITLQDFQGNIYSTPTNNTVNSNMIANNGQYGVYRFESPRNPVAERPQRHSNTFRGNVVNLADYLRGVGVNTLPAPKSRYAHHKPVKVAHKPHRKAHTGAHPPVVVAKHARPRIPALFHPGVKTIRIEHHAARRHR
jgi:parallel beta-helix repeat protein